MADKGKTDTAKFINLQDKINNDIGKIKANLESFRKRNAKIEKEEKENPVFQKNKDRFATLKDHLQKIKNNYINYLTRKQIGTTLGLVISEQLKEKERIRQEEEAERLRLQEEENERIRQEERRKQDEEEERLRRQEEEKGRLNNEFEKIISSINKNLEEIDTLSNGLDKEEKEVKDFLEKRKKLDDNKKIQEALFNAEIKSSNFSEDILNGLTNVYIDSETLLNELKQLIEYLKTKHEKASIALALSINISNEEKRKKIEEEKKRKEEEERKEKELQEKLKRLSEEEAERVLQKIRKEKEQTQIAVAITNSIQLQEKIKNLQNKLQDLFDQRKDKITEFEEMYNKLKVKDLFTEFKSLENFIPIELKEVGKQFLNGEVQLNQKLAEMHENEDLSIPTTVEELDGKINEITKYIDEIENDKLECEEEIIPVLVAFIKALKLEQENEYKNKVNELTSIGLGLAVSEKINEEKKIEQIVNKIDVFDDSDEDSIEEYDNDEFEKDDEDEAEEVEDKEEEEIEKEKKLLEKELNMIAIGLQNVIKNVIEDENRKKLEEEERDKERQEEKRKLDELFERKMKEQKERELEQELVSIALPLTIKNKLDAEKMALNIPLEDLNKNNLQTALTIALNEAIAKKNKKGTKKLDQKKINALLAAVSTLLMLLVKSRKPKQDNKSTDIQTNTVTDRDVNEQEKILYARRQEEDVLNDHLHEVCVNAFNEQFKMGEVLPTTGPRQRPIYSSHDDEFCYGLIVNEEQDPSGNYYQTSIRNVKCPFNKTYVEGRDKGEYKSGKCIDASAEFVREKKGDNEKKDPDTKSKKSPGEPLIKEGEKTTELDQNSQNQQKSDENDKKIIKKEPGSPEIKKEFVDEKKNSEREKEIIQNGLALAIINNLKN